tara:strand:- start:375 stop:776 length:402 start_codon:yes stop_codon:yes gene_type:complete
MNKKIDHIGIAVKDLNSTQKIFETIFNTKASKVEIVESENIKTVFLKAGTSKIELLEDLNKDGVINNFIEKRGPGIHHLAIEVNNIKKEIKRLQAEGFSIINSTPSKGANGKLISFLHPKETAGVLIEICQKK